MGLVRAYAGRVVVSGALVALALWWGLAGLGIIPMAAAILMWCK